MIIDTKNSFSYVAFCFGSILDLEVAVVRRHSREEIILLINNTTNKKNAFLIPTFNE